MPPRAEVTAQPPGHTRGDGSRDNTPRGLAGAEDHARVGRQVAARTRRGPRCTPTTRDDGAAATRADATRQSGKYLATSIPTPLNLLEAGGSRLDSSHRLAATPTTATRASRVSRRDAGRGKHTHGIRADVGDLLASTSWRGGSAWPEPSPRPRTRTPPQNAAKAHKAGAGWHTAAWDSMQLPRPPPH